MKFKKFKKYISFFACICYVLSAFAAGATDSGGAGEDLVKNIVK